MIKLKIIIIGFVIILSVSGLVLFFYQNSTRSKASEIGCIIKNQYCTKDTDCDPNAYCSLVRKDGVGTCMCKDTIPTPIQDCSYCLPGKGCKNISDCDDGYCIKTQCYCKRVGCQNKGFAPTSFPFPTSIIATTTPTIVIIKPTLKPTLEIIKPTLTLTPIPPQPNDNPINDREERER